MGMRMGGRRDRWPTIHFLHIPQLRNHTCFLFFMVGGEVGVLGSALGLLLSLYSGINPGRLRRTIGDAGDGTWVGCGQDQDFGQCFNQGSSPSCTF